MRSMYSSLSSCELAAPPCLDVRACSASAPRGLRPGPAALRNCLNLRTSRCGRPQLFVGGVTSTTIDWQPLSADADAAVLAQRISPLLHRTYGSYVVIVGPPAAGHRGRSPGWQHRAAARLGERATLQRGLIPGRVALRWSTPASLTRSRAQSSSPAERSHARVHGRVRHVPLARQLGQGPRVTERSSGAEARDAYLAAERRACPFEERSVYMWYNSARDDDSLAATAVITALVHAQGRLAIPWYLQYRSSSSRVMDSSPVHGA
eukprot:scaffold4277_cov405-Prasinococcus_capsulatus_cf.AAC.8